MIAQLIPEFLIQVIYSTRTLIANLEWKGMYWYIELHSWEVFYSDGYIQRKLYSLITKFFHFRDLNLTLPKQGTTGKHGVANLSFTYTYADKQRYQKQLSLEQEEEDSVERESKISTKYRHQIEDDKFTRFWPTYQFSIISFLAIADTFSCNVF